MKSISMGEEAAEDAIDFKRILVLFWQHKWIILNAVILAVAGAALYAYRLPDTYTTSAQLFIEDLPAPVLKAQTDEVALRSTGGERYSQANIALMKSRPVLQGVVEQLGLQEKFAAVEKRSFSLDQAISKVQGKVAISYKDFTYTIAVTYSEPFIAASIANALTKVFIKRFLEDRLYLSEEIRELFPDQAFDLAKYTSKGQMEELSQKDLVAQLPSVRSNPDIASLREKKFALENEITKLSMRYKEKHPKMIEARATLYFTNERLNAKTDEIVNVLKQNLVSKFQENNIRVLNEASVPGSPSGPNRQQIILVAALVALVVSFGLIVLLDMLDDKINNEDDLERHIRIPFLGAVFRIKKIKDEMKRDAYVMHEPFSETAEALKNLRVNINFATSLEHRKMLLITSTLPQEGKTFIAANLAISKAQDNKKVLLIDADLRRPRVHKIFGLENKTGFSNVLTGDLPLEAVIQKTPQANLDVVASGPPSPNPPELFGSQAMEEFLDRVSTLYDSIIFDAPPSYGIPDALVLGSVVGSLTYVIQAHRTSYKLIAKTRDHLQAKGVRIIGAVLNNLERGKGRAAYYYDTHYHSYTYTKNKRTDSSA